MRTKQGKSKGVLASRKFGSRMGKFGAPSDQLGVHERDDEVERGLFRMVGVGAGPSKVVSKRRCYGEWMLECIPRIDPSRGFIGRAAADERTNNTTR